MGIYFLNIIYKVFSFFTIYIMSCLNDSSYSESNYILYNVNGIKNINNNVIITPYDVEYIYDPKIPYNISYTLSPGMNAITHIDSNNAIHVLQEMTTEVVLQGSGAYGLYTGKLTGYGPDCVGCSTVGNVSCMTPDKKKFSLINDGIYYYDKEYGNVRILAAASAFPCGTIIKVTVPNHDSFYAIVMDRGGSMAKAWGEGRVWMDLAYESETKVNENNLTSKNVIFDVQRWGY